MGSRNLCVFREYDTPRQVREKGMISMRFSAKLVSALALACALSACTTTRVGTDRLAERDPLEGFNRGVWAVNRGADKVIVKPVSSVYRAVAPKPARDGVRNFFSNLGEPFSFINNILQGKPDRAFRNLGRFVVNTTVGIGGLFDNASRMKIKPAPEDLGQTMAAWGMNGGPYIMLPLFGPSTLRDGVGLGLAQLADPYNVCLRECGLPEGVPTGMTVAQVISIRAQLTESGADNFLDSSLDPYAAARSAYLQRRRAAILNHEDDDGATEAAAAADAEANQIGADPASAADTDAGAGVPSAADTDAGIPATDAPAADAPASPTPPSQPQ